MILFLVSFSWFCFFVLFCFHFFFRSKSDKEEKKKKAMVTVIRFYIALEILFWLKKKLSEGRGLFRAG